MPLFSEKPGKGLLGETFLFSKSIGDVFCATFSLVRKSNQKRRFTFFLLLQKEPKSSRDFVLRPRFKALHRYAFIGFEMVRH